MEGRTSMELSSDEDFFSFLDKDSGDEGSSMEFASQEDFGPPPEELKVPGREIPPPSYKDWDLPPSFFLRKSNSEESEEQEEIIPESEEQEEIIPESEEQEDYLLYPDKHFGKERTPMEFSSQEDFGPSSEELKVPEREIPLPSYKDWDLPPSFFLRRSNLEESEEQEEDFDPFVPSDEDWEKEYAPGTDRKPPMEFSTDFFSNLPPPAFLRKSNLEGSEEQEEEATLPSIYFEIGTPVTFKNPYEEKPYQEFGVVVGEAEGRRTVNNLRGKIYIIEKNKLKEYKDPMGLAWWFTQLKDGYGNQRRGPLNRSSMIEMFLIPAIKLGYINALILSKLAQAGPSRVIEAYYDDRVWRTLSLWNYGSLAMSVCTAEGDLCQAVKLALDGLRKPYPGHTGMRYWKTFYEFMFKIFKPEVSRKILNKTLIDNGNLVSGVSTGQKIVRLNKIKWGSETFRALGLVFQVGNFIVVNAIRVGTKKSPIDDEGMWLLAFDISRKNIHQALRDKEAQMAIRISDGKAVIRFKACTATAAVLFVSEPGTPSYHIIYRPQGDNMRVRLPFKGSSSTVLMIKNGIVIVEENEKNFVLILIDKRGKVLDRKRLSLTIYKNTQRVGGVLSLSNIALISNENVLTPIRFKKKKGNNAYETVRSLGSRNMENHGNQGLVQWPIVFTKPSEDNRRSGIVFVTMSGIGKVTIRLTGPKTVRGKEIRPSTKAKEIVLVSKEQK